MTEITFINAPEEKEEFFNKARRSLDQRAKDMKFYSQIGTDHKENETETLDSIGELINNRELDGLNDLSDIVERAKDLPDFHDYGLCFDYVELGTFDDQDEDYFRYQFSWGGPSEELRMYENGIVEFVYLDWFCGIGFRIDDDPWHEEWVEWLWDWFEGAGLLNFEEKRGETNYYAKKENEEEEEE